MKKTLFIFRIFFLLMSAFGCVLLWYAVDDWELFPVLFIGMSIALLVILTDKLLKGFSLRGLSAITFGLLVGSLIAYLLANSPLFEPLESDPAMAETLYLSRLVLYIIAMYLATVVALRGKDEFNLVIPYVRFSPENVDTPLAVVDTSALIDGRIEAICESKWLGYALMFPRFVLNELQEIADSPDPGRKEKGRKGLDVLNRLRKMPHVDLRIHESDVPDAKMVDSKLVFLAQSMKAKLLTTDYNLAKMAEFHGVEWLNITALVKALNQDVSVGTRLEVQLVRPGKESGQAVGFLPDGSMLVVNNGRSLVGKEVCVEVDSVVPSAGGKMVFATPCLEEGAELSQDGP
ncbi:MAG: PIN/TRAM domain-containing protein [Opitutales bacterium]